MSKVDVEAKTNKETNQPIPDYKSKEFPTFGLFANQTDVSDSRQTIRGLP